MDPVSLCRHAATMLGVSVLATTIQTGCSESVLDQCVLLTKVLAAWSLLSFSSRQVLLPAFHVPSKTPNTAATNTRSGRLGYNI